MAKVIAKILWGIVGVIGLLLVEVSAIIDIETGDILQAQMAGE